MTCDQRCVVFNMWYGGTMNLHPSHKIQNNINMKCFKPSKKLYPPDPLNCFTLPLAWALWILWSQGNYWPKKLADSVVKATFFLQKFLKSIVRSTIWPNKWPSQLSSQIYDQKISSQLSSQLSDQNNFSSQLSSQLFGKQNKKNLILNYRDFLVDFGWLW